MKQSIQIKANGLQFKKSIVILWAMVKKNVKNQYRRSTLGILWTVLNPLLTMLVMAFVFSTIFGRGNINMDYPLYVLSGNIVFGLIRSATIMALPCMVNNYDLLTKTRVPYFAFPASSVATAIVNFFFSIIALLIVMLVRIPAGVTFHPSMLMIIVPWLPAIIFFALGMSLFLCSLFVRFRDLKHLYDVFLTLWMYMTPVFYSLDLIGNEKIRNILQFNPMYYYLQYFREVIVGVIPSAQEHVIIYGIGICTLIIGWMVFKSQRKQFILFM